MYTASFKLTAQLQKVMNFPDFYVLFKKEGLKSFFHSLLGMETGLAIYFHFKGFLSHDEIFKGIR